MGQLSRILATDAFRRSPSLGRFLKYLVDQALAGECGSIKEYRLGLEVFDRGEDFDPRDDTIVRVQARNLRARLDAYYEKSTATAICGPTNTTAKFRIRFLRSRRSPAPSR
jgi:hypothetical protein